MNPFLKNLNNTWTKSTLNSLKNVSELLVKLPSDMKKVSKNVWESFLSKSNKSELQLSMPKLLLTNFLLQFKIFWENILQSITSMECSKTSLLCSNMLLNHQPNKLLSGFWESMLRKSTLFQWITSKNGFLISKQKKESSNFKF